ncbi:MAG TPA: hypothetical protein VHL80_10380 [Polyangia bacterium]|nr:hypothetical protein [Polyangia bacterium]
MGRALALATLVAAGCSIGASGAGSPASPGTGAAGSGSSTGYGGAGGATGVGSGTGGQESIGSGTAGSVSGGTAGSSTGFGGTTAGSTGTAGAEGPGSAGATGTGGAGGGFPQDGGSPDGAFAGAGPCIITITPVVPSSFSNLEPGAVLRVQASVTGYPGGPDAGAPRFTWSAAMVGGSSPANLPIMSIDDVTAEVTLGDPGMYQVNALIPGVPSCDRLAVPFTVKAPETPTLRFVVTPPDGLQLPERETVVATTDLAATTTLDLGDARASELLSLSPVDARNFPVASYIRITSASFGFALEGYTGQSPFVAPLSTGLLYDVLVLPDGGAAPLFVSGLPDVISTKMALTPDANVTGVLRDGAGNPVSGARVLLVSGARPSTVGTSGADGRVVLTTREGAHSADIVPRAGSGLPEALVAAPAITLLTGMTSLDLSMDWANVPASPLTIAVTGPGGAPVAGARVRVDLATPIANAGILRVLGGATAGQFPATGTAHADGVTDAQGAAHLGLLPEGPYHVIVAPPDGTASTAITLADVTVPAAGAAPVALAAPLTFMGKLAPPTGMPGGSVAGAKVTAIDGGLLASGTPPTTTAGADGSYALALAAGRTYELLVEPDPKLGLARWVVGSFTAKAGSAPTSVVPAALAWRGTVTGAGRTVSGAFVQVFCKAPTPTSSCVDPSLALAQGTSAADGSISLALPLP